MGKITYIISILIVIISYILITSKKLNRKNNHLFLISKFGRKFTPKHKFNSRFKHGISDLLMSDPDKDIHISTWDNESLLREKADIHKTRLNKYGRSKLNGEMFFMEKEGEVFRKDKVGEKIYV